MPLVEAIVQDDEVRFRRRGAVEVPDPGREGRRDHTGDGTDAVNLGQVRARATQNGRRGSLSTALGTIS